MRFFFFVSWKINCIFENQDICISLLHGFNGTTILLFNGTTILLLEPVELIFVVVYILRITFVSTK